MTLSGCTSVFVSFHRADLFSSLNVSFNVSRISYRKSTPDKHVFQNCSQLLTSSLVLPLCPAPWATLLLGFSYYCTAPCDTWPIPFWPFFLYSSRSPACSFLFWSPLLVIYHSSLWFYSLSDHRSLWSTTATCGIILFPSQLLVTLTTAPCGHHSSLWNYSLSRHSSLWLWPPLLVATTAPCGIILRFFSSQLLVTLTTAPCGHHGSLWNYSFRTPRLVVSFRQFLL